MFEAYSLLLCEITRGSEDHNNGVLLQFDVARIGVDIGFDDSVGHCDEIVVAREMIVGEFGVGEVAAGLLCVIGWFPYGSAAVVVVIFC